MSWFNRLIGAIEVVIGRRALWRVGRLIYRYARRDVNNQPETNGEYVLHQRVAKWARSRLEPLRVIDVGSNIGYWTSNLLDCCREAGLERVELWAFEPSDEIREVFIDRMKSAPPNYRISVRSAAVSDSIGHAAFDGTPGISGVKHILTEEAAADAQVQSVDVMLTTLAKVFEEEGIDTVDFVKTDVEGFDLSAIRGARPLLEKGRIGLFQFEYNYRWISTRSYLRDVFDLVEDLPYRVGKIVPDGIDAYPSWQQELETFFEANYVLVREDLMDAFEVRRGTYCANNTYAVSR